MNKELERLDLDYRELVTKKDNLQKSNCTLINKRDSFKQQIEGSNK